jgi:hypothetical protein
MKTKAANDETWTPFIHRALDNYKRLPPSIREEVRSMAARGYSRHPSDEAMAWWLRLPGLPRHNRVVFSAIRDSGCS